MFYKLQGVIYRNNKLSDRSILDEVLEFTQSLPEWPEKPMQWLIAHPEKELVAIKDGELTDEALEYIQQMIDDNNGVGISLADKNKDDSIIKINFMNLSNSSSRYNIALTAKSLSAKNKKEDFLGFLGKIISFDFWDAKYYLIDTEQYRLHQSSVFHDRLPVGWMLYLPIEIKSEDAPSAYELHKVSNDFGTIIISKDEFNGKDPLDIACANNVEIELAANGLLPLIKGM